MAVIYRAAVRCLFRRLPAAPRPRFYGAAAAQLEHDYESEWEEELAADRRRLVPAAASWEEEEGRGVRWVFMGSPAAQKHVYATRVAALLDVPYISMGSLVRQELHPRSVLYKKIANAVNEGKLVPEDIIFGLLSKRLEEGYHRGETGFILDGIPRTRIQAEILDQITDIDLVVNFKCMEDCLVKKHFGSDVCSYCGKSFDANSLESTSLHPCLATRTGHSRLDTSVTNVMKESHLEKFRMYSEQSKLLEEYYRKQNKLLNFQMAGGPGETWQGLLAALHLQHINAVNGSQKLTA
ncbi:Adenylate kinase/UMP-CMP kinase protein [Dioscorea alata]|uniref:Adenylate kinase/UMP-CMP kinase protein n=1 Tax=Dioscorea alata TaxID=55571 RepID=A0ACB7W0S0_DIOAL|nr:Adenylate kinase/UMP-CMP kinase protein [Dioscorea alata]